MKFPKILFINILLFFSVSAFSQVNKDPYSMSYAVSKINYKAGDTVDFIINIRMDEGWYLYSAEFPADGPIKFETTIEKSNDYVQAGSLRAYKPFTHYDEVWEAKVAIFEKHAQFRIPLIVKKAGAINFKVLIEGQFCKDACIALQEKVDQDLSSLPFSDYIVADTSVYSHYGNEAVEHKQNSGAKKKRKRK